MPRVAPLQNNFSSGEFSPLVQGRVDSELYHTGLDTCLNYIPLPQGGLVRRPGTRDVAEVKTSAKSTRLVEFEFSTTQAYVLEFGDQYIRFYKDHAQIESGGSPYEISSPYLKADLFELKFTQSNDVLFITHPDYAPRTLSRTSDTSWALAEIAFSDGPYLELNTSDTQLTGVADQKIADNAWLSVTYGNGLFVAVAGSGTGNRVMTSPDGITWSLYTPPGYYFGPMTVVASDTAGINGGSGFVSTDVGRKLRMFGPNISRWGWAVIDTVTSTTEVEVTAYGLPLTGTLFWRLGLWSDTTGYPAAVTFHEDRLTFGGSPSAPQRVDGSQSGDYYDFAPTDTDGTVTDSNAISFTLNARRVNNIHWLLSDEKGLLIGTAGAEWVLRPSVLGEALSPTNVSAKQVTEFGSANIQAITSGKSPLFIQRAGRKLRELRFTYGSDGFEAIDRTLLAEHITQGGVVEMTRQPEPYSVIWMVRGDGTLVGMTHSGEGEGIQVAAHRHVLGGVGDASGNPPVVESVASIPDPTGTYDEVWMVVKRYINGATVRRIEYTTAHFDEETALEDAELLDSSVLYDGAATTTITGLSHLEGETVTVFADGALQAPKTVSGGQITIDSASRVLVGYSYNSDGKLLRLEAGSANGTALGKQRRMHYVGLLLYRTLGLKIGMSFDDLDTVVFRTTTTESDTPPPLYSGVWHETVEADYDYDNQFCWRQDGPFPGTILAVVPQMETQDR